MGTVPLTAYVLAGGKSTRMGQDKAVLTLQGRTLLEIALFAARAVAGQVYIVGPAEPYGRFAPTISDIYQGCGPLAGIHAALSHSSTNLNLILAVDTPFLSPKLLSYLTEQAATTRSVVTAPEVNAYPQPLCAIYSGDFLPIADNALRNGQYKIVPLFPEGKTLLVPQTELEKFAFNAEMFDNLNTPEEFERAGRRTEARKQ
jgi:molybdopterin-guanine dinucleotide biosynthesis protein A